MFGPSNQWLINPQGCFVYFTQFSFFTFGNCGPARAYIMNTGNIVYFNVILSFPARLLQQI